MPPKQRSPDDVHDIFNVEVGRPYRGSMVVKIDIETTDLPSGKVKVRRLIHCDSEIILIEDTWHEYGDVFEDGKLLPYDQINFPSMDPADFEMPVREKDDNGDDDEKKKKRELLRQRAKDMIKPKNEKKKPLLDDKADFRIKVRTPEGKILPVAVKKDNTVGELTDKLEKVHGISFENNDLCHNGKSLDRPNSTLDDCGIKDGDVLDLEPKNLHIGHKNSGTSSSGDLKPKGKDRKRVLNPDSAWVFPKKASAPKKGEIDNLQGVWSIPPVKGSGTEPVEVNIHPLKKEPKSNGKSDIHGAYGYINGAKPNADGVVDPANVVFYPPGQKEYSPDFDHMGWWSAPESFSKTTVSWRFEGYDCFNVKTHTVNVMGHEMIFVKEWKD